MLSSCDKAFHIFTISPSVGGKLSGQTSSGIHWSVC